MKQVEELYFFFKDKLLTDIGELERSRLKLVNQLYTIGFVLAAIAIVIIITFGATGDIIATVGSIAAAIFFGAVIFMSQGYRTDFKEKVIRRLITFLDPGLKYDPTGFVMRPVFEASGIFRQHIDDYKGDDKVWGKIGETTVEFSELHAQYETHDSKGRKHHTTIFKGLFFIADFNKNFNGHTEVLPDPAQKMFGVLAQMVQGLNIARGQLIKLEDPEFENEFVVYGDDQTEARYILSPSLMKRILNYKKNAGKKIALSFVGSKIYVAISYSKDLFEPRIFRTMLSFAPIKEYAQDLDMAMGVVDELNLNTRIWTKE
jgi:hypothetical protein